MIEDLIRGIFGLAPSEHRINKDIATMRALTRPAAGEIIPWEKERELELISLNITMKAQKDGMDKIHWGAIQSIYFEPMAIYAYKDYVKGVRTALLYVRTKELEFIYRIGKSHVDLYFNGKLTALIDINGVMHGVKSKQALAYAKPYSSDLIALFVSGRDAGHLFNPTRPHSYQQRAFSLLSKLDPEDELIFIAHGFYELLTRWLTTKKRK